MVLIQVQFIILKKIAIKVRFSCKFSGLSASPLGGAVPVYSLLVKSLNRHIYLNFVSTMKGNNNIGVVP